MKLWPEQHVRHKDFALFIPSTLGYPCGRSEQKSSRRLTECITADSTKGSQAGLGPAGVSGYNADEIGAPSVSRFFGNQKLFQTLICRSCVLTSFHPVSGADRGPHNVVAVEQRRVSAVLA
jgi:hypothetical protein